MESDPYLGAKTAGREIHGRVSGALRGADGRPHAPSLLCALGAIAGHACQASIGAQAIAAGRAPDAAFDRIRGADGKTYFNGDVLRGPLASNKMSIWHLATGAAGLHGARTLPDLLEIFEYNDAMIGRHGFGVPRLPPEHGVRELPIDLAGQFWPALKESVSRLTGNPKLWPIAAGLAIQEAIAQTKGSVGPEAAVRIVMESAIPVAKIPIAE
jgi:hypothetical protein